MQQNKTCVNQIYICPGFTYAYQGIYHVAIELENSNSEIKYGWVKKEYR